MAALEDILAPPAPRPEAYVEPISQLHNQAHQNLTVDGLEREDEEEIRNPPSTRRQLERMHQLFRTNLISDKQGNVLSAKEPWSWVQAGDPRACLQWNEDPHARKPVADRARRTDLQQLHQAPSSASEKRYGIEPDVVTLAAAVHSFARGKRPKKAEEMFEMILMRGQTRADVVSFNALIDAWVKAEDVQRAKYWLERMLEVGVEPTVISYTTVLNAYAKQGNIEAAEEIMEQMKSKQLE
ncbi:unnamed protein product, partial [Durusdinium trenchii]